MNNDQKNRQLQYIKGHYKWLVILSISIMFIIATGAYGTMRILRWKMNYTDLHSQTDNIEFRLGVCCDE